MRERVDPSASPSRRSSAPARTRSRSACRASRTPSARRSRSARPPSCSSTTGSRTSSIADCQTDADDPGQRRASGRDHAALYHAVKRAVASASRERRRQQHARPAALLRVRQGHRTSRSTTASGREHARRPRGDLDDSRSATERGDRRGARGHRRRPREPDGDEPGQRRAETDQFWVLERQRRPVRHRHQEPGAELRRAAPAAQPIVTFEFTDKGREAFAGDHARDRPARRRQRGLGGDPGPDRASQHFAIVLDNELDLGAVHRLHARTRTGSTARSGAQISGGFTIQTAQDLARPAEDRRAADQARADLALAGVRDARPAGARPGPDRGPRGLRDRRAVPARLLPRARRDRGRRARASTRSTSSR